jgi:hypothetical protein
MAVVKTLVGAKLIVQIENDTTPGVFGSDCLINAERGIDISSETTEFTVPDCDTPLAPGFKFLFKDGLSASITGGGVLHTSSVERWFNWMVGDDVKNVRFKIDETGANGGGYIAGAFKVTGFNIEAGASKELTNASITMQSHGVFTWVDAV